MPQPISLERLAELTARMTSGEKRSDVLQAVDLDAETWESSQAFWLERMAAEAGRGRYSLSERYGALYKTAMARLSGAPMRLPRYPRKAQQHVVVHAIPAAFRNAAESPARPASLAPPAAPSAPSLAAAAVPPPPSLVGPSVPPAPSIDNYTARLTLEQLAAMRAEIALAPEAEQPGVMKRFGLDPTTWEQEENHWQRKLAGDQDLFKRYLKQFQYCRSLLLRT